MSHQQETPMPPDMSLIEAEMAQAAERAHWREINALADKADEAEFTEDDPLVRRLRGRADFLRNRGEIKTPELLESAAKELEAAASTTSDLLAALKKLDKAAMDVVWANNQHEAAVAVHWLREAAKESHAAIAKAAQVQAPATADGSQP